MQHFPELLDLLLRDALADALRAFQQAQPSQRVGETGFAHQAAPRHKALIVVPCGTETAFPRQDACRSCPAVEHAEVCPHPPQGKSATLQVEVVGAARLQKRPQEVTLGNPWLLLEAR